MYFEAEAAKRYVFTINQVRYAGDLLSNRKSTFVSHLTNLTDRDSSNFLLQIAGELHYLLSFENGDAIVAISLLNEA